ncbi:interferon-induced protein with tetratricopeptide repeats 1-like [Labrus bergylta]|uniref:interferon-induced protein with tetratricopeptide repeats 1-like n=1 Tax=Labrus bergylta TaxID=56723 RepID=UPI003313EF1B
MSAAQSQTTLESLQCHFTWDLDCSKPKLLRLTHKMEDFSTEKGNRWLGHNYNLWGFIQYKLGLKEEAKGSFQKAAKTLNKLRNADEGAWLVVNYGNLAWLHHDLGELEESQAYLSKVHALMKKYPSPSQDELHPEIPSPSQDDLHPEIPSPSQDDLHPEIPSPSQDELHPEIPSPSQDKLHPEIYAEKAWTLMFLKKDMNLVVDYFEKAASMQPDMVEWNTSYVIASFNAHKNNNTRLDTDLLEKMRQAKERDPENLYLAALYLEQHAAEVRELAGNVSTLCCSNSGMWTLLNLYRKYISADEAIVLAEKVLKEHPDVRFLKRLVAFCYRWRIVYKSRNYPDPEQSMVDRAIPLHEELLKLYPDDTLENEIDLATIYAKSHHSKDKAEQIYQKLLTNEPAVPKDKQMLYNRYATHLYFNLNDSHRSIEYHMKVAAIPEKSSFRKNSIRVLKKNKDRGIEEFLRNLQEPTQ